MDVRKQQTAALFLTALTMWFLLFPRPACAVEVGCFCTFVFVSIMFLVGIGATLIVKFLLSKKMGKLSFKRTTLITGIEVVLMLLVLILLQTKFYIRVLVYLPLAFLLNYAMMADSNLALREQRAPKKRAVLAALSCVVLPLAVQVMAVLATFLSNMITFKEVSV